MEDRHSGIQQFKGVDYSDWAFRMEALLNEKRLWMIITDTPSDADRRDPEWIQGDATVRCLIIKHIAPSHTQYIRDKATAKDMWESLENTFQRKSRTKRIYLKKKMNRMHCEDDEPLESFFLKFDTLVREYKGAGGNVEDEELVIQLLSSLPERYDTVATAIETIDSDKIDFDKVKVLLLEHEIKKNEKTAETHPETDSSAAFHAKKSPKHRHQQKRLPRCFNCNELGHKSPDCPEPSKRRKNSAPRTAFVAEDAKKKANQLQFIIDSGASDHLVGSSDLLTGLRRLDPPIEIKVAKDSQVLTCNLRGNLHVNSIVDGREVELTLLDTLVAPGLRSNLLSVHKITEAGGKVSFQENNFTAKFGGRTVLEGHKVGSLWIATFNQSPAEAHSANQNVDPSVLWHRRLGHLGMANVWKLVSKNMVDGIKDKVNRTIDLCEPCVKGKSTRRPFSGHRPQTTRPLERVHTDICGPIPETAIDGSRYFITFKDDWSNLTVTYLMKTKSEALDKFIQYKRMAEAHWDKKIERLRCDRGSEYLSNEFRFFCKKEGVVLDPTGGYDPEANGVSERTNRTILDKARSMLCDSGLGREFWGEAVLAATYLANRSPTTVLEEDKTPFEKWFSRRPDLSTLRVFGCQAFSHIPKQKRKKMDDRAEECVMVGYDTCGYRLYNPRTRRVFPTRHMTFCEIRTETPHSISIEPADKDSRLKIKTEEFLNLQSSSGLSPLSNSSPTPKSPCSPPAPNLPSPSNSPRTPEVRSQPTAEMRRSLNTPKRYPVRSRKEPERFQAHTAFSAQQWLDDAPISFSDVAGREDEQEWRSAIKEEIQSLEENQTWKIIPKPEGAKLLTSRWILKIKPEPNGDVRYKARLVAKGFLQKKGIDYQETYAPVARMPTIRLLLSLAVQFGHFLRQLDVKTAFLYGKLEEDVFLKPPEGVDVPEDHVLKLQRSLYGLKQSPKCWNDRFHQFITGLGFDRSESDYCLYFLQRGDRVVFLVIYVDDMLMSGNSETLLDEIVESLKQEFKMKDLGTVQRFMGLNVNYDQSERKMTIDQTHYSYQILERFGMEACKPVATPMISGLKLQKTEDESTQKPYRELIGSLMFLAQGSRPDISFALSYLSRYQDCASDDHWGQAKRLLRYLQGSAETKLVYTESSNQPPILCFADADWGTDPVDRKSTTGFLLKSFGNTIMWCSKKQPVVALSSTEAEYTSACAAACEALWLKKIYKDLHIPVTDPVTIMEDNQGSIQIATNPETKRTKHVDIKYHFLRHQVWNGNIRLQYVPSSEQEADILTKALPKEQFNRLRSLIGLNWAGVKSNDQRPTINSI